jgi:hypothetical protein
MNRIVIFFFAVIGLSSCGINEHTKLQNQSVAFEETLDFLHEANLKWPAELDKNEKICREVKNKACLANVKNALDTIAQCRIAHANFQLEFRRFEESWLLFKNAPEESKNYTDFLNLCTQLNKTEILMDYWGNSVAEEMAKIAKCFEQNN